MIRGDNRGFTLIEIITVIVILAILSIFTVSFLDQAIKTYTVGTTQRMIYQEASYALERMTRELRDMTDPATWTNGTTYDTLSFTRKHATLDATTNITFRRDTATKTLYRDGGASNPVCRNVTEFKIVRTSTSTCDRSLEVSLTLQDGGQTITMGSRVTPKNLGSSNYTDRCFNGDYEDVIQ